METAGWIALSVFVVVLIWFVANYNRFVRLRYHLKDSWAGVDVELKRRHDLIPNLVSTVKGFAAHERDVLERVVESRGKAMAAHAGAEARARDEGELAAALRSLFAVAENYPQLRSDAHFLELQRELATTEDRIAAARRFYNANVRDLKSLCEQFPTSILAALFGFRGGDFFELDDRSERTVPAVRV